MELLKVENLSFTYPGQDKPALRQVSFTVNSGEFVVLCGESGCGKTTLLRLLKRELAPHGERTGEISYLGCPQQELDERTAACEIGFVMQNPENQIVMDKVWHELAFGLENMGLPQQKIRRRVGEMACFFGIDEWFRKETHHLSGGQKQLLNLASIMAMQPKLLILDEPTLGLDVMSREAMLEELQEYLDSEGTGGAPRSVLISSHISSDLEKFCDDIYMIDRGRIVLHGETDVLLDSYGILKVDERQYQALDRRYLLAGMREAYGYRLLTNERRYYQENYPDLVMEKGSIDDILILTARGEKL